MLRLYIWMTDGFLAAYALGCWQRQDAPTFWGVMTCFICAFILLVGLIFLLAMDMAREELK